MANNNGDELVRETINVTLAAGAKVLKDEFHFSDKQAGTWILKTALLLAEYIGTDESKAQLMEALSDLDE